MDWWEGSEHHPSIASLMGPGLRQYSQLVSPQQECWDGLHSDTSASACRFTNWPNPPLNFHSSAPPSKSSSSNRPPVYSKTMILTHHRQRTEKVMWMYFLFCFKTYSMSLRKELTLLVNVKKITHFKKTIFLVSKPTLTNQTENGCIFVYIMVCPVIPN